MRKGFLLTAVALCIVFATTQAAAENSPNTQNTQSAQQKTTLRVSVTIERQEIVAGPYARYAQKYLGVAAPLANKVTYQVTSANIVEASDNAPRENYARELAPRSGRPVGGGRGHMNPESGFPRLTIDKTSAAAMSLEESARLAAEKIFTIRKSRFDLITGEVGENVFGGGLDAALAEMNRLEEEYLSLFLGLQTLRTEIRQYHITPTKGKLTYTVCRYSDTDGLLPEDDLRGEPMVLELKATADSAAEGTLTPVKPSSRAVARTVPAEVRCRVILDGRELASEILSVSQLGETVYVIP